MTCYRSCSCNELLFFIYLELCKVGYKGFGISGTTVACVHLRNRQLYVASVGDSGVILGQVDTIKGPIAEVVSAYHKPNNEQEEARIVKMGGRVEIFNKVA